MRISLDASLRAGNLMLTKAGITGLSGAASTFSTGGTITFSVAGQAYTKTAFSSAATPTTYAFTGAAFVALTASKQCVFVFGVDSGGNAKVAQGPVVSSIDVTNGSKAVQFPEIPDTMTPFAYAEVTNGSSGTSWTFGTSNWNQTGITIATPVDVILLPASPLTT